MIVKCQKAVAWIFRLGLAECQCWNHDFFQTHGYAHPDSHKYIRLNRENVLRDPHHHLTSLWFFLHKVKIVTSEVYFLRHLSEYKISWHVCHCWSRFLRGLCQVSPFELKHGKLLMQQENCVCLSVQGEKKQTNTRHLCFSRDPFSFHAPLIYATLWAPDALWGWLSPFYLPQRGSGMEAH